MRKITVIHQQKESMREWAHEPHADADLRSVPLYNTSTDNIAGSPFLARASTLVCVMVKAPTLARASMLVPFDSFPP